ncbi:hypothetical protein DM02DRAFT_683926, partial [Periconia macrospinosa]
MIQPVIARWISEQHKDVPNHHSENEQPSIVHTVEEQGAATEPSLRASNGNASIQGQVSRKRVVLPWISERSDTHGSMEEQAVVQSPKHGSKVASNAKTSMWTEGQSREVINATVDGLNNLRKQHRHKSAARQQKAQVRHPSPTADSPQPTDSSPSLPSQAVTGSGHWRQLASAKQSTMDFDAFNEELSNPSLFYDIDDYNIDDLWLRSPPPATATQPINEQQSDGSLNDGSGDDDELYENTLACEIRDDGSEGTFGDEEHVLVASDQYSWKIDHAKGDHKIKVRDFVAATESASFDGDKAIDMLQKRYTMDYGSKKAGSRAAAPDDEYIPSFFLDLLIIIGRPLKPITQPSSRFFDNMTISFKNWRASYSSKHIHGLSFDLEHRTFRLATAATREAWYVVMHPVANAP